MKRLLAVYAFLVFMMLAWGFGARAQLGSNTRTIKADVIDANTSSLIEFLKDIEISSTGYVLLPKGTTAQRPGTPKAGMFRYNTTDNTFEGYTTEWGPIAGGGGLSEWTASTAYEADDVVFLKDDNVYKVYLAKTGFTSGGAFAESNWLELSKSRSDQNELLLDGSFEYGVFEWSCTSATVTQAAGGVDGDFQAQIDFTADGGFCELTSTVSGDTANQEYLPRAYVKTSDATVKLEFLDGTRLVAEPEVLTDGSYQSYAAQVIPSTSIVTKITGDNTDQAFVDAAGHTLGGFNRAASKNCSSVLDCENELSAKVSSAGVVSNERLDFIDGDCVKTGSSSQIGTCSFVAGTFTETPNCSVTSATTSLFYGDATIIGANTNSTQIQYQTGASTSAGYFRSSEPVILKCSKQGSDYKTTEDKGVVTIPDNKDARLVVTNEGTTTNQTIGAGTITVAFDTVKPISKYIDFASNEATFLKSGRYELNAFLIYIESGNSQLDVFPEIDTGSGFSSPTGDDSKCVTITGTSGYIQTVSCDFIFEASKGDKLRLRATSDTAGTVILNTTGRYPRMVITPLGSRQNIGEFAGTAVYDGESGTLTSGYASFGGETDESVCSSSPCTRYREVGDLADNMSVTWQSTGNYEVTVTGLKASSFATCSCSAVSTVAAGSNLRHCVPSSLLQANISGELVFPVATIFDSFQTGNRSNSYFHISCTGLRP